MVSSTIRFVFPEGTDWDAVRALLRERANLYLDMPGLISKAFLFDPATREYGGNYVWESAEALRAFLDSAMFAAAVERFGTPTVAIHEIAAYIEHGVVVEPVTVPARA